MIEPFKDEIAELFYSENLIKHLDKNKFNSVSEKNHQQYWLNMFNSTPLKGNYQAAFQFILSTPAS